MAVAGAAGPAGRAALLRLAEAGATVVAADADAARLAEAVDAARYAHGGATVTGDTVDLLDLDATRAWADRTEKEFGRIDGLVHLVGGWRGSATFAETDLADWELLEKLLIRTVQHTSLAFEAPLCRSGNGRYLLVSAAGASKPTAGNAAYSASKAAAEAWTLRSATPSARRGAMRPRPPRPPSWWSRRWCTTPCAPSGPMRNSRVSPTSRTWRRPSSTSGRSPPRM
ncbi:hypothetical protein GCM10020000_69910 [Streptomyces olivoverticillatus]